MNLEDLKRVVEERAKEVIQLTEDTLEMSDCSIEDCFPATQLTSFDYNDETYRLKIEYTISKK